MKSKVFRFLAVSFIAISLGHKVYGSSTINTNQQNETIRFVQNLQKTQEVLQKFYNGEPVHEQDVLPIFSEHELLLKEFLLESKFKKVNLKNAKFAAINNYHFLLSVIKSCEATSLLVFSRPHDYLLKTRLQNMEAFLKKYLSYNKSHRVLSKQERAQHYLSMASFLSSTIAWSKQPASIALSLSSWYRRALLLDPKNKEAKMKLITWYSHPANYNSSNWNYWILAHEEYLKDLASIEKANASVEYSMFFMRTLQTKKSYEYLEQAIQIQPNNFYIRLIEDNYKKGKIGF